MPRLKLKPGQVHCSRFIPEVKRENVPFRKACHFLMTHKDWHLCVGFLVGYVGLRLEKIPYAWCEKGRRRMDPRFDTIQPKKVVVGFQKFELTRKFTYRQASFQMRVHHRYCKWERKWNWGFWRYVR